MTGTTLVIGYGNPLCGDDAAGPRVAAAVARWRLPGVRALAFHQLAPELAADLSTAACAVFVDAAPAADTPAATLSPLAPAPLRARPSPLGHVATPGELLALTSALYDRAPASWYLRVPAEGFELGQPLSPGTRRGIRQSLQALRTLLAAQPPAPPDRGRRAAATPAKRGVPCPTR
jgi:hydrogenase maturation protease